MIQKIAVMLAVLLLPSLILADSARDKVVLNLIQELIKKEYVEGVTDKQLTESAISGMLSGLDPHCSFLNEKEFDELKLSTKGEFGGLGVEILAESIGLRIISPIDDTPAYKAGIKAGDLIIAVNQELITNMTPSEAVNKMRGPKDTKVKISILREGEAEPLEFEITRDLIKVNPIKHHLYHDIGYVRISTFSNQTADAVKKAIEEMDKQSAGKMQGYILDLRNNPGGLLEQAVFVSDLFLDEGIIVSIRGKDNKEQMVFKAESGALIKKIPLVVLINNGTASAPEIVAGALQDHKRAIILGTKSFGKGSVQTVIPIPNYGAIRMTTARYYTPSGRSIQAEGIVPDITVEPAKIELLGHKEKKFQYSEANLKNHLTNKTKEKVSALSLEAQNIEQNKAEFWKKFYEQDYQLARAVDVLKTMKVVDKWK